VSQSPLISARGLDDVLAWRADGPVRVAAFLADALAFAEQLPAAGDLINLCEDRYRFAVGFAAGLLRGRTSLQPSSLAPQSLQQLAQDHPGAICLVDAADAPAAGLPELTVPPRAGLGRPLPQQVPLIDDALVAAVLFTSGSTGRPQPHPKRWGHLVRNGRAESAALGLDREPHVLVGTVPIQHSYGFESTFLLALHGGCSFWSGKPFFPQDITEALAAVPAPRLLVTTPFHLANWLAARPAVLPQRLLSATAPLAEGLAQQAEAACGGELHEIYGSTESSALASRRTVQGPAWTLLPGGVRLSFEGDVASAGGGHVEGSVPLADLIEPLPGDGSRFVLHGRHADLINIAGKRTSLAYLNRQLAGLPGVQDAAFFLPDDTGGDAAAVTRLVAFAVAPGLGVAELMAALRERVDPIFLPRPLVLLPALPRNATGKLTREALGQLHRREVLREPD
jgi:acyl-coenzyme A synthetase/AMP-(fatty) acid ligase